MAKDGFWLLEWMDQEAVTSARAAQRVVNDDGALRRLAQHAESASSDLSPLNPRESGEVLVAGKGIDLSSELECQHFDCRKKQVDRLFSRVWHYFDRIVVECMSSHELPHADVTDKEVRETIHHNVRLLLYLREIGAEQMLLFREKPPACRIHARDHLSRAGLQADDKVIVNLTEALLRDGRVVATWPHGDHFHYSFHHPTFTHSAFGVLRDVVGSAPSPAAVARDVVEMYVSNLAMDVTVARLLRAPFGSDLGYYDILLRSFGRKVTEDDVAFEIQLPFIEDIAPRDLIKLRHDERESFERFRVALRKAIAERMKASGSANASALAIEIERDILRPAVLDVDQRLRAAQQVLTRKAATSLAVGAFATTCGLVLGVPLLVGAGAAATAGAIQAEYKFIEESRDIRLTDMYFLWKAAHAH